MPMYCNRIIAKAPQLLRYVVLPLHGTSVATTKHGTAVSQTIWCITTVAPAVSTTAVVYNYRGAAVALAFK
jgi:hypothetical protein